MIYTVIETRADGSLSLLSWEKGTPRLTLKWMAKEVFEKAKSEGKAVEWKEWNRMDDAYKMVRDHNNIVYAKKLADNRAKHQSK